MADPFNFSGFIPNSPRTNNSSAVEVSFMISAAISWAWALGILLQRIVSEEEAIHFLNTAMHSGLDNKG